MNSDEATTDFLRTLARAETASAEERWAPAAALWAEIVVANPVEGRFWSRLGEARHRALDYRIWIAPALYAPPTFAAVRENRDPALEAILACREHLPGW